MSEYEVIHIRTGKVLKVEALKPSDALLTVIGWADEIVVIDGYLVGGMWKVICHPSGGPSA
jgi:hypothetical protein